MEEIHNTEDDRHHIIGSKPKPHEGVSPRNLLVTTIAAYLEIKPPSGSVGVPLVEVLEKY